MKGVQVPGPAVKGALCVPRQVRQHGVIALAFVLVQGCKEGKTTPQLGCVRASELPHILSLSWSEHRGCLWNNIPDMQSRVTEISDCCGQPAGDLVCAGVGCPWSSASVWRSSPLAVYFIYFLCKGRLCTGYTKSFLFTEMRTI